MCPELIIEGHVYSAIPPLFKITTKSNDYIYLKGQKELDEYKEIHGDKNIQSIGRMKGIGEMDAEEVAETLLDTKTRNIVQLTVSDIGATDILFENLYGRKVEPRVKYILEHSEEATID